MGLLTRAERSHLITILVRLPFMREADSPSLLLRYTPRALEASVKRSGVPEFDVANVIDTAESFGELADGSWATITVVESAAELMEGTMYARELRSLADRLRKRADEYNIYSPLPSPRRSPGCASLFPRFAILIAPALFIIVLFIIAMILAAVLLGHF